MLSSEAGRANQASHVNASQLGTLVRAFDPMLKKNGEYGGSMVRTYSAIIVADAVLAVLIFSEGEKRSTQRNRLAGREFKARSEIFCVSQHVFVQGQVQAVMHHFVMRIPER
jgi:hypothetical protein